MWPFKRKELDIKSLKPVSDDGHRWGVAEADVDSSPLIVRYNQSARDWIAHSQLPIKLGFAIPLNSPNENGLPDPEENEQLNEIEDVVLRLVASRTPALHVLTLTTGIMKEFVFYIPRGVDIRSLHESIQTAVVTHKVQCMATSDPKWGSYMQFSPT